MASLYVIGEDVLCCSVGERLIRDVLGWELALPSINTGGVTHLVKDLHRYLDLAKKFPVLCIADTDRQCVVDLRAIWLRAPPPKGCLLRLAVPMIESWLLADAQALAAFLMVTENRIPRAPDDESHPKRSMLSLAEKSKRRELRDEMVGQRDASKPGTGYNTHLSEFVSKHWQVREAAERSPSLARAIHQLEVLKES